METPQIKSGKALNTKRKVLAYTLGMLMLGVIFLIPLSVSLAQGIVRDGISSSSQDDSSGDPYGYTFQITDTATSTATPTITPTLTSTPTDTPTITQTIVTDSN
jgi:hypothetical protein